MENENIDFSKTDYRYITDCNTDEIATKLIQAADESIMEFYDDIETALYNLKNTCQNRYNNDYFRKFLYILTKATENINID